MLRQRSSVVPRADHRGTLPVELEFRDVTCVDEGIMIVTYDESEYGNIPPLTLDILHCTLASQHLSSNLTAVARIVQHVGDVF